MTFAWVLAIGVAAQVQIVRADALPSPPDECFAAASREDACRCKVDVREDACDPIVVRFLRRVAAAICRLDAAELKDLIKGEDDREEPGFDLIKKVHSVFFKIDSCQGPASGPPEFTVRTSAAYSCDSPKSQPYNLKGTFKYSLYCPSGQCTHATWKLAEQIQSPVLPTTLLANGGMPEASGAACTGSLDSSRDPGL